MAKTLRTSGDYTIQAGDFRQTKKMALLLSLIHI